MKDHDFSRVKNEKMKFMSMVFIKFCGIFFPRLGGIPAKHKDENLLIFLGIIDILQSYR